MKDGYQGLDSRNRFGCLSAGIIGLFVLFIDLGRFFGDPAPGTEDLWWRHVPPFIPTIVTVVLIFLITRIVIRRNGK